MHRATSWCATWVSTPPPSRSSTWSTTAIVCAEVLAAGVTYQHGQDHARQPRSVNSRLGCRPATSCSIWPGTSTPRRLSTGATTTGLDTSTRRSRCGTRTTPNRPPARAHALPPAHGAPPASSRDGARTTGPRRSSSTAPTPASCRTSRSLPSTEIAERLIRELAKRRSGCRSRLRSPATATASSRSSPARRSSTSPSANTQIS